MSDAELVGGADQRQAQELRVPRDSFEKLRVRHFEVFQSGIDVGFAFGIEERGQSETADESLDLAGGHGFLFQIYELNLCAAFFEESFGGAGGGGIFQAEDLDGEVLFLLHSFAANALEVAYYNFMMERYARFSGYHRSFRISLQFTLTKP